MEVTETNIDELVALYEDGRRARLLKQKQLDLEYQNELGLKDKLINFIYTNSPNYSHILNNGFTAMVTSSEEPFIVNFEDLAEYIRENNAIDLLQKRLTPGAVKLRWKDGLTVPGIGASIKHDLKIIYEE
jgi:hypothetical protein